ncbi:MAG: hypothetical protein K2G55_04545 [Lachnospiraceae bacterium]|nr:hypothetical protein [Lachnospiraceae bacterium]MDE7200646.1 hypothetical protein [Lachnospiraceae bacterium]
MSNKKKITAVISGIAIVTTILIAYSTKIRHQLEFAQIEIEIETQTQEDTASAAAIESQPEETKTTTVNTMPLENMPQSEETAPVQTGFVAQDGELYYYDEQGNRVTGWFEVNDNSYCADSDGRLFQNGVHEIEHTQYLFTKDGACLGEMPELESDEDIIRQEGGEQEGYQVIRKAYNADGSFIDSYTHSYDYDGQGRLREEIYYYSGGGIFRSAVYHYDGQGRPGKVEYGGGGLCYEEVCIYDEQGRLDQVVEYDGMDKTLDYYSIYSYDGQGKFHKTYYDGMDEERDYYYDSQYRLCKIEMDKGYAWLFSYDEQGGLRKSEFYEPNGSLSQYCVYSYDEQGGLHKSEIYDSNGNSNYYYVYSYDGQSNFIIPEELIYFEFGWVEIPEIYMLKSNKM